MTTPIEDLEARMAAMRADITALQDDVRALRAAAAATEQERQRAHDYLRSLQDRNFDPSPQPRR